MRNLQNIGPKIAYFSMEIGLMNEIPTYSGGLGVLAGDTLKSGADPKTPISRRHSGKQKRIFPTGNHRGRQTNRASS